MNNNINNTIDTLVASIFHFQEKEEKQMERIKDSYKICKGVKLTNKDGREFVRVVLNPEKDLFRNKEGDMILRSVSKDGREFYISVEKEQLVRVIADSEGRFLKEFDPEKTLVQQVLEALLEREKNRKKKGQN